MKKISIVLLLLLNVSVVFSQNIGTIKGKVIDAQTRETLPFVSVIVQGTSIGNSTDYKGEFIITNVPLGYVKVSVSFLGYESVLSDDYLVTIDKTPYILIELAQSKEQLDEVVDPFDRDSMIFADGAGACIIEATETETQGILSHAAQTDALEECYYLYFGESFNKDKNKDVRYIKMLGRKIYEYGLNHVPLAMKSALDKSGLDISEVKKVFIHQANEKMDEAIIKRFYRLYKTKVPKGVLPMSIHKLGNISNYQLFLNKQKLKELNLDTEKVSQVIANEILEFENVYKTVTARTLQTTSFTSGILKRLQNGYNQKLSGDILFVPNPSTISYSKTGTTHGSGYAYDTHVPLIFYGAKISKGSSNNYYPIVDIAPTLASFLNITEPNGSTGSVIIEVLE